ncbi:helix-turn-helix domain-containing protein [Herbidospora galbida]|uniref:helix-turn-helix domain-containing protein n=1 Tax=Herbidospora galbida TaxID=2575442 RepID=UPI001FE5F47C|nr:helix-turn-helix domain-containing protein [Herbidospora galbida]
MMVAGDRHAEAAVRAPPQNADEERKIRKLAGARHGPSDWIMRAQMIVSSWQGLRTSAIAAKPGCHIQTVRERLDRSNAEGLAGLGDRPGVGRKPRITAAGGCCAGSTGTAPSAPR